MAQTNIVRQINGLYTYAQIKSRIFETTGRTYSEAYIGNVARGFRPVNDKLLYSLERTFPEFFGQNTAIDKIDLINSAEKAEPAEAVDA